MRYNRCSLLWCLGVVALVGTGCKSEDSKPASACPEGVTVAVEGTDYCVLIEEGFLAEDCPPGFPIGREIRGVIVCSAQADIPEDKVAEELDDRGIGVDDQEGCQTDDDCPQPLPVIECQGDVAVQILATGFCDQDGVCQIDGDETRVDCAAQGQTCSDAQCQDRQACARRDDCPDGEVCELGGPECDTPVCVAGCQANTDCGDNGICTQVDCVTCPCPGQCQDIGPAPACRNDADCGDGEVCELGGPDCSVPTCVQGCHENRQCGQGSVCTEVQCVTCPCPGVCQDLPPEADCRGDGDCQRGEVCELGGPECDTPTCVAGCHDNEQCGQDRFCQDVQCVTCPCPGQCADLDPEPECRNDGDCAAGEVCELGGPDCNRAVCVPGCHDTRQCGQDQICEDVVCVTCPCPGRCQDVAPDPICRNDEDCGDGQVCELGGPNCRTPVCVRGCHDRADCADNQACQQVECLTCPCPGQCQDTDPEPACRQDGDCAPGEVCEPGGPNCTGQVCVPGCHNDAQCADSEGCTRVECFTCPCPGQCEAQDPDPICRTDDDCGPGEVCEAGGLNCRTPMCVPGCRERADCPRDADCVEVQCIACPCPPICQRG